MPVRSNPFQKLILRIHQQLAPLGGGVIVEESTLTDEPSTGCPRETDVCMVVSGPAGVRRVAIECRDHTRPQSIEWIDSLIGKYADLGFDEVIAVSTSGFSDGALAKAKKFGIQCRRLEDVVDTDWPAQFTKLGAAKIVHQVVDETTTLRLTPPVEFTLEEAVFSTSAGEEFRLVEIQAVLRRHVTQVLVTECRNLFPTLADLDRRYHIEIVRVPHDLWLTRPSGRHQILSFTLRGTLVTTKQVLPVRHEVYPGAMVSTLDGERHGLPHLTMIQSTERALGLFKGSNLERVEFTPVVRTSTADD